MGVWKNKNERFQMSYWIRISRLARRKRMSTVGTFASAMNSVFGIYPYSRRKSLIDNYPHHLKRMKRRRDNILIIE